MTVSLFYSHFHFCSKNHNCSSISTSPPNSTQIPISSTTFHHRRDGGGMSSACTLVGCGMRNITSCFFARRLRFEEKSDGRSPETSSGSIVFDFAGGGSRRPPKKSHENGGKSVQTSPSRANTINGGEAEPDVAEEDYLVFLFREDGAIDIINEGGSGGGEDEKVTAAESVALEKGEDYETKEVKMDRCDSNLSDTSSASFAFPILKIEEWIGSPVHMPKHQNQTVRLHCCRF